MDWMKLAEDYWNYYRESMDGDNIEIEEKFEDLDESTRKSIAYGLEMIIINNFINYD